MQKLSYFLVFTCCLSITIPCLSQVDPVLFSVADIDIPLSEFQYIYTKNNRENADYSRASVTEYLDLYTRFKLKVKRAHELQLDTITALQKELAGYRMQLAKSYLNDKQVVEKLTREVYDRMQSDIRVAHIMFKPLPNPTPEDLKRQEERMQMALTRAKSGEDFAVLASEFSEDKNTSGAGGELGYVSAMLPSGFYEAENVIYALSDGQVSDPVKSSLGTHIFKVLDRRPARGVVEASHIFVRVKSDGSNEEIAKQKIFSAYQNLKNGKSFEDLVSTLSDDQQTAKRGGYIGRFGINEYEPAFENAVFSLTEPGTFTEPVRTRVGWHIIKLLNRVAASSYEEEKTRLEAQVAKDERVNAAKAAMIEAIKKESGLTEDHSVRDTFINRLKEDFLTFQWNASESRPVTLIQFADGSQKSTADFAQFLRTKARERMRAAKTSTAQVVASNMYKDWINEICIAYEEARLEKKYPEFRALMREYEEGILLFEVTKMMVWDKASQDTAGLIAFHEMHREDYMWPERADVVYVTVEGPKAVKVAAKARKLLAKYPIETIATKLNKKQQQLSFLRKRYLVDEYPKEELTWEKNWMSPTQADAETGNQKFSVVTDILPPQPKALDEARGFVIADYQDHLEKEWVENLRQRYPVKLNNEVLNSLIRE